MTFPYCFARRFKHLPPPKLLAATLKDESGYYLRPQRDELLFDRRHHDLSHGLIVYQPGDYEANTIAHEYRHHLQWCYGVLRHTEFNHALDYETAIVAFFAQPIEQDAQRWASRVAPSQLDEIWREILLRHQGGS